MQSILSATSLNKRYGDYLALNDVSLEVRENEFLCIIGPSGCGKTTLLRILAGFVEPDAGDVLVNGKSLLGVPPYRRPLNLVFQNYALFPHMNVAENIGFGLTLRKLPADARKKKIQTCLEQVDMVGFEQRRVTELSGGQQQRVALARALALDPLVLLLDEPLGALDQKVRRRMQEELKRVQREIGITFIHVTHDQEEALAMADRIAVMNKGRLEQLGTGREVYRKPTSPFVADFVGESNKMQVSISPSGNGYDIQLTGNDGSFHYVGDCEHASQALIYLRHEDTLVNEVSAEKNDGRLLKGLIVDAKFIGDTVRVSIELPSGRLLLSLQRTRDFDRHTLSVGDRVTISARDGHVIAFPISNN